MYSFDEMIDELFCADIDLTRKEKKILKTLNEMGDMDFIVLLNTLDIKPSKLAKHFSILNNYGFVDFDNETNIAVITDLGKKALSFSKKDRKEKRKMLDLIDSLNDEELDEFKQLFEVTITEAKITAAETEEAEEQLENQE